MEKRFIRLPEVMDKVGLKKSKIWAMVKNEEFPQPIKLTAGTTVWIEEEVDQWIRLQIINFRQGSMK